MTTPPRSTLRDLPLPAKLVVSLFLLAVGLGYFSAMVQLHMQHSSRNGDPLPGSADVVAIFAGKKQYDPSAPQPVSKLEKLVMGPIDDSSPWNGSGSMGAAFFKKSKDYRAILKDDPDSQPKVDREREGERLAIKAWIHLNDDERKAAYEKDAFRKPETITDLTADFIAGDSVKIKSILEERCTRCHMKGEAQENYPLETYEHHLKYLEVARNEQPDAHGWISSDRQMSVEKLTQSTHAHLLSFAVLFGLTGFIFAFTGFPSLIRLTFAPLVLVAQVLDVSCWWLARIPDVGPYFAYAIIATGGTVALGLVVQILGSLFDMYGRKGRLVLVVMFVLAAIGFAMLAVKVLDPALTAERAGK